MIEILQEYARCQTTSQRLADQARTIMNIGWFFELEILEIQQKINNEQAHNIIPNTSSINKKTAYSKWTANFEKWKSRSTFNTQQNNQEQTLTPEEKVNVENFKRIMNGEKITLPSLRNIEWRTLKTETNKINQVLSDI